MRSFFFVTFLSVTVFAAHSQTYIKTLRGPAYSNAKRIINTKDGGWLIAAAGGNSSGATDLNFFIIKFGAGGKQQWAGLYGTDGVDDEPTSAIATKDGGYLITGFSTDATNKKIGALIKVDSVGNKLWSKTFAGTSPLSIASAVQTGDGGYLAGGTYTVNGTPQAVLIKLTANGTVTKYLAPNSSPMTFRKMITADNGDIVMLLDDGLDSKRNKHLIVERVSASGTVIWAKRFSGTRSDFGYDLIETADKGFAVTGGNTVSKNIITYMATTARLDAAGNVMWYRSTNADNTQGSVTINGYSLLEDDNGNLISCGTVYRDNGSLNIYLLKYTGAGTYISSSYIDLPASSNGMDDYGRGIIKLKDGYLLVSNSLAYGNSAVILEGDASFTFCSPQTLLSPTLKDTAFMQNSFALSFAVQTGISDTENLVSFATTAGVQSECTTAAALTETKVLPVQRIKVYPNPTASSLTVTFTANRTEKGSLQVYDLAGNRYVQLPVSIVAGENSTHINVSSLHSGTYKLMISYSDGVLTAPFYKQ